MSNDNEVTPRGSPHPKMTPEELQAIHDCANFGGEFDKFYKTYYGWVYSTCLGITKNIHDAEDLTQDVFLQISKNLHRFRGDSTVSSWVYRVAVNQVLMRFRKKSYRSECVTNDGDFSEFSNMLISYKHVESIDLRNAIASLPRGYRQIFILHDIWGMEHDEIALKLGICSGTSKSQLHKARYKLREKLAIYAIPKAISEATSLPNIQNEEEYVSTF